MSSSASREFEVGARTIPGLALPTARHRRSRGQRTGGSGPWEWAAYGALLVAGCWVGLPLIAPLVGVSGSTPAHLLAAADVLAGSSSLQPHQGYPPLVPGALLLAAAWLSPLSALRAISCLGLAAAALGIAGGLSPLVGRRWALVGGVVAAGSPPAMALLAAGDAPSLLAAGLVVFCTGRCADSLLSGRSGLAVVAGAALGLASGVSYGGAVLGVLLVAITVVVVPLLARPPRARRRATLLALSAAVFSIPFWGSYSSLTNTEALDTLPWRWPVGFSELLLVSLGVAAALTVLARALEGNRGLSIARVVSAAMAVFALAAGATGLARLPRAVANEHPLTMDQYQAVTWLAHFTAPDTLVAASAGQQGAVLGNWVEGLAGRRSWSAAVAGSKTRGDTVAASLFDKPDEAAAAALAALYGVGAVVVDGHTEQQAWATWGHGSHADDHLQEVFRNASVAVFAVLPPVETPRQQQIIDVYEGLLGHPPDRETLVSADTSTLTVNQIKLEISCVPESLANHQERQAACATLLHLDDPRRKAIADLFPRILGRPADLGGIDFWDASGVDVLTIEQRMRCSAEYLFQHPDGDPACPKPA